MADNITGIPFSTEDEGVDFVLRAKLLVMHQINVVGIGTPRGKKVDWINLDDIYVFWFAYILGNYKAMISTTRPDGRIWEVTFHKETGGTYIDSYLKTHNIIA